ncbi:hypothetical protein Enr10x_57350 [Gimesia panareensis]|uniref:Uncharacterized protein n=1 Tax=Gimesia panareensis TaxID=2527978 RepID=A0A517QFE6_9PLAN|nr:hypothetical protein [Gimesia panareensis]QDT30369.1 hypothetical protein Enr10x_57350 [Gimesia panareensis]
MNLTRDWQGGSFPFLFFFKKLLPAQIVSIVICAVKWHSDEKQAFNLPAGTTPSRVALSLKST